MNNAAAEQFARFVVKLEPYASDVVLVGGWVHSLYLAEANGGRGLHTDDVDVTIPSVLLSGDRPTLLTLAEAAGFERDPISDIEGANVMMIYTNEAGDTVPIDFLTEGEPRRPVEIMGQSGLLAQGYPGQQMLLENARDMKVGPDIHALLSPPRTIRVPQLGAYGVQKGLSSRSRKHPRKAAKDLAYLYEIARHPSLGTTLFAELPDIRQRYPSHYSDFEKALQEALNRQSTLVDMAEELDLSNRALGSKDDVARRIAAYFNRILGV